MKHPDLQGKRTLRGWLFALVLAVVLVSSAVAATPQGRSLVDNTVSATGGYYQYLSIIFKS